MNEEASLIYQVFLLGFILFFAYYPGVYIQKAVFPSANSPILKHQFLIAIPLSVAIVAPLLAMIGTAITDAKSISGYFVTIGIIIEHGLFMNEVIALCYRLCLLS